MRLSDLLASEVVHDKLGPLGTVDDVRFVQDGPVVGAFGASLRVDGIVIGRGGISVRLGFHRAKVKGPAPLNAFFTRLEKRARYVPWSQVTSCRGRRVSITGELGEIPAD